VDGEDCSNSSGASVVTNKIGSNGVDNRPVQKGSDRGVKRANDSAGSVSADSAKPAVTAGNAGVRITDSARQLAALEQAIRDLPDVDEAKVAAARAAIADGTYQVSPDRIADKLIRLERELK
jgi:negative regulator of flagellin synthesis FlgM